MSPSLLIDQSSLSGMSPINDAVDKLSKDSTCDERGAVFTRIEVVEFMLNLVGYTSDKPLHRLRLLEPSFGGGEFLLEAVRRLLAAWKADGQNGSLDDCIRGVELHTETFKGAKADLLALLSREGITKAEASRLASCWLSSRDFLLAPIESEFDFVVGNPPYVRQELIPRALINQYRKLYSTLYDRADLYIPFIERSLRLLRQDGTLAFICADRWTKNRYGGPLRSFVSKDFHLRSYVDMVDTPAFSSEVIAYPAITIIQRAPAGPTMVAERPVIDRLRLARLSKAILRGKPDPAQGVSVVDSAVQGSEPWVLTSSEERALLRRLEARFPLLEEVGCKVGIGVATGADKVFIGSMDELDVEPSRKLPLATTKDITSGSVQWRGYGVINPFEDDGKLVDLADYPKLRAYLEEHRDAIAGRHVAQRSPTHWYRTIDRITPSLAKRPKLLIPDIKGSAHVVYEEGKLYPHHNLYFVLSQEWDLQALQAVLMSHVTKHFVTAYATTMSGGFLRFQAQYLRRIRLPHWVEVPQKLRKKLIDAAQRLDQTACDQAACELYGLYPEEAAVLTKNI
jgi:hypothetical protein